MIGTQHTFFKLSVTCNKEESKIPITIKIGNSEVSQESKTKLLGVILDDDQKWTSHISKLIPTLNSRLFLIKRLSNYISKNRLKKIADSLYTSKIRYGIELLGNVRMKNDDPTQKLLGSIQVAQNKLARFLNGNTLMDKINTTEIFKQIKIPSVNQINAQTKVIQVWKSQHSSSFPIQWQRRNEAIQDRRTRSSQANKLTELTGGLVFSSSFISDAARIWNLAPEEVKSSKSLYSAKKRIQKFSLTLPL